MSVMTSRPPAPDVGFQIGHRESVGAADPNDRQLALLDDAAQRPRRDGQEAGRLFRRQQTGWQGLIGFRQPAPPSGRAALANRFRTAAAALWPHARPGAPKDERVSLAQV